ncbi:unnamed protein product [Mytilus coruscus]|uniref:Uncharacterized protein n=1 Tax=Mytilus coruscus TaxID=42192 RepID=A0A6J8AKZ4_MYTCO|nr:unnamed protein product [Mytilus coruscus]
MASSEREESPPSRHSDINVTDRDTVTNIADITFNNFKQYFDSKIGSLKRELKEDATNKSERVVKQLKSEHSYKFKFNGNQVQHEFNSDIDYEVSRIKRAAEREDYSKVRDICSDIIDKIHKRNKCIKIADKSPAGWDTVKEYMSDDLASNSEDEKRRLGRRNLELCVVRSKRNKNVLNVGMVEIFQLEQHLKIVHLLLILLTVIFVPTSMTSPSDPSRQISASDATVKDIEDVIAHETTRQRTEIKDIDDKYCSCCSHCS